MRWISRSRRGREQCKNGHSIWAIPSVQSEVLGNKYQSKTEESIQKVLIQQKAIAKKSQHFGLLQGCGDIRQVWHAYIEVVMHSCMGLI